METPECNQRSLSRDNVKVPLSLSPSLLQSKHVTQKISIIPDYPRRKQHNSKRASEKKRGQGSRVAKRTSSEKPIDAYQDYSTVKISDIYNEAPLVASDAPFSIKLHKILSNPAYSNIICWLPHGRSWRMLQPKVFEEKIIPLYFRHARISSFMRQVNGWGFRRISRGVDMNSYYHELFLKGMPHLCLTMRRLKKSQMKKHHDPNYVPDFYNFKKLTKPEKYEKVISKQDDISGSQESTECPSNDSSLSNVEEIVNTKAFDTAPVLHQPNSGFNPLVRINPLVGVHNLGIPSELEILRLQQQIIGQRLQKVQNPFVIPNAYGRSLGLLGAPPAFSAPTASNTNILMEALVQSQMQTQALRAQMLTSMENGQVSNRNENSNLFSQNQLFPRFM